MGSDGSGSSVEDPPLLPFPWGMVPELESVLTSSVVVTSVDVQGSVSAHLISELEASSITDWWVLVSDNDSEVGNSDNLPSLVGSVVAVPPDDMSHVMVVATMDIEALSSVVSDVSS